MFTTSVSLLEKLRRPGDQEAWKQFTELYTHLLYYWARRLGLQAQDTADLVQDVFLVLARRLPEFAYDQHGSFRAWLRTILLNQWRNRQRHRSETPLDGDDPAFDQLAVPDVALELEEADYRQHLLRRALEIMQTDFEPVTWKACWEYVVAGRAASEVAAELGISIGAVYVAKSRVLSRLRQELAGLLD